MFWQDLRNLQPGLITVYQVRDDALLLYQRHCGVNRGFFTHTCCSFFNGWCGGWRGQMRNPERLQTLSPAPNLLLLSSVSQNQIPRPDCLGAAPYLLQCARG